MYKQCYKGENTIGKILDSKDLRTREINGTKYIYINDTYFNLAKLAEGGTMALEEGKHGVKITIWSEEQPNNADVEEPE